MDRDTWGTKQRAILTAFMQRHNLRATPWALRAGINPNTLRGFLKSRTDTLSLSTVHKLATAADVPVTDLLSADTVGDTPQIVAVDYEIRGDQVISLENSANYRLPGEIKVAPQYLHIAKAAERVSLFLPKNSLVCWREPDGDGIGNALNRVSIVQTSYHRYLSKPLLGDRRDRYRLITVLGVRLEDVVIVSAWPVLGVVYL